MNHPVELVMDETNDHVLLIVGVAFDQCELGGVLDVQLVSMAGLVDE